MEKLAAELHVAKPKGCCTDLPVESIARPVSALGDPRAELQRGLEPLRCSPQRRPEQDHQHEAFHYAVSCRKYTPAFAVCSIASTVRHILPLGTSSAMKTGSLRRENRQDVRERRKLD
jgi:hypothetical protein